jgi:cytochrome c-type biogenesis protein CcmH/NrfG
VITAFKQVMTKLQDGRREEAMIGLEFVLRLDPAFAPATNLQEQLASGQDIDLSAIISQLQAPSTDSLNELVVEAVEDFNQRRFDDAKKKVEQVLHELPGHQDARALLKQIEESQKGESQVAKFLDQARQALAGGDPQEAANFVMMAQALDPHHPGIQQTLQQIQTTAPAADAAAPQETAEQGAMEFGFETTPEPAAEPQEGGLFEAEPVAATGDEATGSLTEPSGFGFEVAPAEQEAAEGEAPSGFAVEPSSDFGAEPGADFEAEPVSDFGAGPPSDFAAEPAADPGSAAPESPDDASFEAAGDEDQWQAPDAGDFSFDAADDAGGLFDAEPDTDGDLFAAADDFEEAAPGELSDEERQRIKGLLEQGETTFQNGDYDGAIATWTQVLEIDPANSEATRLLEEAHLAKADQETAAAPAAAPDMAAAPDLPDLEEDLFEEDLPAVDEDAAVEPAAAEAVVPEAPPPAKRARRFPVVWLLLGFVGLVVLLVGVWFGRQLLSSDQDAQTEAENFNRLLDRADQLAEQNQIEEAILLLQEYPASDLERSRIDKRIERYQGLANPTPTPIPEALTTADELLRQGLMLQAYETIEAGLARNPVDEALLDLKEQINRQEPLIGSLHVALKAKNYGSVVSLAEELLERHPGQPEFTAALERSLFNAALVELRSYNLTGAEVHLVTLTRRRPDDEEARRILSFVNTYKARPVDMRLKVFIGNLSPR